MKTPPANVDYAFAGGVIFFAEENASTRSVPAGQRLWIHAGARSIYEFVRICNHDQIERVLTICSS